MNTETETSRLGISKSFFYRVHLAWNNLPLEIRELGAPSKFKAAVIAHLWNEVAVIIKSEFEVDKEADMTL